MTIKKNGQQQGEENFQRFKAWIDERYRLNDWHNYIRGGKLNRTEISKECLFDRGVFKKGKGMGNPDIVTLLEETENYLLVSRILEKLEVVDSEAFEKASEKASKIKDMKLTKLEEENSILKSRVNELEEGLRKYDLLERHMGETGRLIR